MGTLLLKDISWLDKSCDILIDGETIARIAAPGSGLVADETMDCSGKAVMPAFVNMHTHAAMSMMRGIKEDTALGCWLSNIWDVEDKIDEDYVHWATKVAILEMIRTGTTVFNDQYWLSASAHEACAEMGVTGVIAYDIMDKGDAETAARQKDECRRMYEDSLRWKDGSIFSIGFHAIYTVSEQMMLWASDFARKHGLLLHIHLAETTSEVSDCKAVHGGLTPTEYLDSLGILDDKVIAAHTLWLTPHDIEILGKRHVSCVHNINSNIKLASGYRFMYNELRDAGANVCLGTDGCASSNNMDMLEAAKTASFVQKAWRGDPAAMPLEEAMAMATANGAKALGLKSGLVKEGYRADLLIIDTDGTWFLSPAPFLANYLYSAHSDCINSVMCRGKFLMRDRKIASEREILEGARQELHKLTTKQ